MTRQSNRTQLLEELIELLHVLGRHIGPGREQIIFKSELNHAQLKFLYFVSTDVKVTIPKLIELSNTTPGAVTQITDGLIDKGFLQRDRDELDKRRVYITFSPLGKKKFEKMKGMHIKFLQSLFGILTDIELEQLISIQRKLVLSLAKQK